ncbi:MAG: response regulator [Deltaproteobacteria bacterium]|jgi:signal transduction histidine kinase/CheY-like chemotaxis protein|nr:response regulator [Deltaproteobacteria bacterium]MBW2532960.1 response regulator [Deltaproteobacteria bacterium]
MAPVGEEARLPARDHEEEDSTRSGATEGARAEAIESAHRRRFGAWLRLAVVSGGVVATLLSGLQYSGLVLVLLAYLPLTALALWAAHKPTAARWRVLLFLGADSALITGVLIGIGPAFSTVIAYYVVLVVGYSLQGRDIALAAVVLNCVAYGAALLAWVAGVAPNAPLLPEARRITPDPVLAGAAYAVVAVALLGTYGIMRRTLSRIEQATETRRRLWKASQEAREARLQQQLESSHRLEALGRLAGGVAHDFNNLLTAILGYAELVKAALPDDSRQHADVDQIVTAGERARQLVAQLLAFSRRQVVLPERLDLNELVRALHGMLERIIGEDVELRLGLAPEPAYVEVDRAKLEQAIMNLAVNARDAMPDGGRLLIETELVPSEARRSDDDGPAGDEQLVLLRIRDNGQGMDEEVRARVFEPFFTTKEVGNGTGLGLAMVYGVITQHDGQITVESTPGEGTEIRILLPRCGAAPPSRPARPEPAAEGRGTVLLCEDDEAVRELTQRVLSARGYRVLVAADGSEAEQLARDHEGNIDLLLSDVVMPGLSGPELLERLLDERPLLRALLMTGHGVEHERVQAADDETKVPLLAKPFTEAQLLRAVREVLED